MIVDSMSLGEIYHEVYRGFCDIQDKITQQTKQYQKVVLGRRMGLKFTPIKKTYKFLTKDKMEFLIDYCAYTRNAAKEPNINIKFVYRRKEGLYCGNIPLGGAVVILSPHFIQRYKERIAKRVDMTSEEVMDEVFDIMRTPSMTFDGRPISTIEWAGLKSEFFSSESMNIVGYAHYGVTYGFQEGKVIMLKTVIGNDTMNERQWNDVKTAEMRLNKTTEMLEACGKGTKKFKKLTEELLRGVAIK